MRGDGRAVTFFLFFLLNAATIAPCLAPSALYLPQLVTFSRGAGLVYLVAIAIATTFLFLGGIRILHAAIAPWSPVGRPLAASLLILSAFVLMGASAFYGKFATYPGWSIFRDLVAAPAAFVAYTRSGASLSDAVVLIVAALVAVGAAIAASRRISSERPAVKRMAFNLLLGSALLWAFRDAPTQTATARVLIAEHSMPAAKYFYALGSLFDANRIEFMRPFIPRAVASVADSDLPRVQHVALVIAECLRADRLPAYGYPRLTTPFIQSESDKWIAIERAYSHGAATAESFPVLFNSQYFAATTRSNDGARALWQTLRRGGVGSAFLSAGAMEWGGVTHALDIVDADVQLIASNAPAEHWRNKDRRFDYAVDDSVPLGRYIGLLEKEFSARPSFIAIHFVGSHYPFTYADTPDVFLPSMRQPVSHGEHATDATVTRISNSFDNAIVHVDALVRQMVEVLTRLGIADDSVIIVTSDHGESLGEHGTFFHGTTLYDEQVRVPLLFRVGGHLSAVHARLEARRGAVAGHVDLLPTILHLLSGTAPPVAEPFDGVSLLTDARKPYELLLYRGVGEKVAIVSHDRKYIFDLQGQRAEEYSLKDDPGEQHNLWQGNERGVAQFTAALVTRGVLPDASRR